MLLGSGRTSKLVPHMLPVDCCFVVVFPLMADFGDTPRLPSGISLSPCQLTRSLK